ncbi:hypothetical protein IW262DRAFT_758331 [Armillaria fumosa]|nr:hypothetical protein IW262DRAFT_758331 [Armillaria fumosa]
MCETFKSDDLSASIQLSNNWSFPQRARYPLYRFRSAWPTHSSFTIMPEMFSKPSSGDALVKSARSAFKTFRTQNPSSPPSIPISSTLRGCRNCLGRTTPPPSKRTPSSIRPNSKSSNSVGIGAEFKGLSLSISRGTKTISTYETTDTQTKTISLSVSPKSTLTFYQKRYRFKITMFFILDAWGQEWNVGHRVHMASRGRSVEWRL